MNGLMQRGFQKWVGVCALLGWCWMAAPAQAQTVSFSLKFPSRGIRDSGSFASLLRKQIRVQLVQNGFGVSGGRVSQGYHLNMVASIEEELRTEEPASCAIQLQAQIIMMPQRRLVVSDVSASGSGRYQAAGELDRTKIAKLRRLAAKQAARYLAGNLRQLFRQIEEKMRNLKPGQVLGTKVGSLSSGRGGGSGGSNAKGSQGKPLPGRPPHLKLIPAGFHIAHARPPFVPAK